MSPVGGFTLHVHISGLWLFTLEPHQRGRRLHAFAARHHHHPHQLLLVYDSGHDVLDPDRRHTQRPSCDRIDGKLFYLAHSDGPALPEKLPKSIAHLTDIAGEPRTVRSDLLDSSTGQSIAGRFVAESGTVCCSHGAAWKATKPKPDRSSESGRAAHEWEHELTTCTTLTIEELAGDHYDAWFTTDLSTSADPVRWHRLYPIDGAIHLYVYCIPERLELGPSRMRAGEKAEHFDALYSLAHPRSADDPTPELKHDVDEHLACAPRGVRLLDLAACGGPRVDVEVLTPYVIKCIGAQAQWPT